jgi:transposase-like protein
VLVGGGVFLVSSAVKLEQIKEICYSLYSQGLKYREIAEAMDLAQNNVEYYVRSWACSNSLPYPVDRGVGHFCYRLYKNNMKIKDIARLLGKNEINIYKIIHNFCRKYNIPSPFGERVVLAYKLREERSYSYRKIAEIVGYYDKSSCYHAIQNYKKKLKN